MHVTIKDEEDQVPTMEHKWKGWRPLNEETNPDFRKKVKEIGHAKTSLGLDEMQKQMGDPEDRQLNNNNEENEESKDSR